MQSLDNRRDFTQVFSAAYSALSENGDYDIVLVHDASTDLSPESNGVLQPSAVAPRQIMHIRVFWIPEHGAKLDHPVAANATIRWYVFGDRLDEASDLLEYSGGGLVLVEEKNGTAKITVRGAYLKASTRRGAMADPLGPCSVKGDLKAIVDKHRVDQLLAEANAADHDTSSPQAAGN